VTEGENEVVTSQRGAGEVYYSVLNYMIESCLRAFIVEDEGVGSGLKAYNPGNVRQKAGRIPSSY